MAQKRHLPAEPAQDVGLQLAPVQLLLGSPRPPLGQGAQLRLQPLDLKPCTRRQKWVCQDDVPR